jgi:MFS family permease
MIPRAPVSDSSAESVEGYRVWAQRRALRALVVAQVFGGAGLAAGVSVGALLARDLLGSTSGAGLPAALFTAGSAAAAVSVGRLSQRYGRRLGLAAGFACGAVGGAGVVVAAARENLALLFVSFVLYGAGTATNLQCRYAGADLAELSHRGRAVSTVLVATSVGAVAGPNLLHVTGDLAEGVGLPRLSGPFVLASVAYAAAGVILAVLLRPDPLLTARRLKQMTDGANEGQAAAVDDHPAMATPESLDPRVEVSAPPAQHSRERRRPLVLAASGMVLAQAVMVAVMTMTPVHLENHGHGLGAVGLIIGLHIGAMYLPSPLSGRLVDTYSGGRVTSAGGVVLIASAVVAASAGGSAPLLAVALLLLGLGWNLSLVGGTAMVTDLTTLDDRARTQGNVDLAVALSGAAGGLASGAVLAAAGFGALTLGAGVLALLVVIAATATRHRTAIGGVVG